MKRRSVVLSLAAAPALIGRAGAVTPSPRGKRHIVMIHGAWHGGWCWSRLSPLLSAAGLANSAPTLTGCGERRHLLSRSITLDTHIQDVIQHIEAEELDNVVLLAHSYGGFIAAGVANAIGDCVGQVILLDAFAPSDGETVLDYAGAKRKAEAIASAEESLDFNLAPVPAVALGIVDSGDAAWVDRRMTPHPVGTYLQPIKLTRGLGHVAKKVYFACDKAKLSVFDATKQRIREDSAWRYLPLETGHDAMVISPPLLADAVIKAVQ